MRCFQELNYPRAEELNPHNHVHKHGVFPFMQSVRLFFGQILANHFPTYKLHIQEENGVIRLTLALDVVVAGEPMLAYPIPPWSFGVSVLKTGQSVDYFTQIKEFVTANGTPSVKTFLKQEANLWNKILYAGLDGYPVLQEFSTNFIEERRRRVFGMLYSSVVRLASTRSVR
jgi:hypothetical protein